MKILNAFFSFYRTILYLLIGLFILITVGPMAVGIKPYAVMSPSMEPTISTGSVAYIQISDSKAPFAKYLEFKEPGKGDVIAFTQKSGGTVNTVVHRIYNTDEKGNYIMKGDNNDTVDTDTVAPSDIVGNYKFSVPYLGNVIKALKTTKGIIIAAASVGAAFISVFAFAGVEKEYYPEDEDDENAEYIQDEEYEEEKPKRKKKNKKDDLIIEGALCTSRKIHLDNKTDRISALWGEYYEPVPYGDIKEMQENTLH